MLVNSKNSVQRHLPKQTYLDKILKVIQRKVLKGTHLPVILKEIQAGYLVIPYFNDVYLYLTCNKLPPHKAAIRRTEILVERYLLLFIVVLDLIQHLEKNQEMLAICENCVDRIIILALCRTSGCH